jgi:hypothetical protein
LPQLTAQEPQSAGQFRQYSPGASQIPLPQMPLVEQSSGQSVADSPGSHAPLPQRLGMQSVGQLLLFSPRSQMSLPHIPPVQSVGHELMSSPGSHTPLPHTGGQSPQS